MSSYDYTRPDDYVRKCDRPGSTGVYAKDVQMISRNFMKAAAGPYRRSTVTPARARKHRSR